MNSNFISSVYIDKLGHNIQEIRERALLNLLSKLERGFIYDNELARCKEILLKLFNWFKFESFSYETEVLQLFKRIFMTESGVLLINLFGISALEEEFIGIKRVIDVSYHNTIDEIISLLHANKEIVEVPPLQCEVPLSYRSEYSEYGVHSTATPIEGFINATPSVEIAAHCGNLNPDSSSPYITNESEACLPYFTLTWQSLVLPDRHVLESVEDTLRNPKEPSELLNSCEFFSHVLIQDFPAEVFLQRPSIIMLFHDLLWSSPSSRITTAILNCLEKLAKSLKTRIHYYSDPSTYNLKVNVYLENLSVPSSPISAKSTGISNLGDKENWEETTSLMKKQMSLQQFCLNTMISVFDYLYILPENRDKFRRKTCQMGINTALSLLHNLVELLGMSIKTRIWQNKENKNCSITTNKIIEVLIKFGEALDYFRLEVISSDWNENSRLIHLHIICSLVNLMHNLIPFEKCDEIVPTNLKNAIANCILDSAFSVLYPNIHETLIVIVKKFSSNFQSDSFHKYKKIKIVCESMSATIKFLRNYKRFPTTQNISLAKKALKSLEFHKSTDYLTAFIEICSNKLSAYSFEEDILNDIDEIVVSLLAHSCEDIKKDMYKICQKKVISAIGAKLNISKASSPGGQILFLLRKTVLQEIIIHGMTDKNIEIQNMAEDILVHILKCKILVSEEIWQQVILALIPVISIIVCFVNNSILGRTVISMLDPDRSQSLNIPLCEVLKGNAALMFSENSHTREEAVSRLCWLLSVKTENRKLLPHIKNLHDKALALICISEHLIDYNKFRNTQHFYQPSGLIQVIELLNSKNIEPVIRRSATTQISVMMEDPILHPTFIEKSGISLTIRIMESALKEDDFQDYPDSVIPCITILKNVCLYNPAIRQELSNNMDLYHYLLRGIFMFCTEERIKHDGSTLLFFLVFANYILGTPLKNDLSLPTLILNKLKCPFVCNKHWNVSENCLPTFKELLTDKWANSSLQIHWNMEWFGGLNEILSFDNVQYDETATFSNTLKLQRNDLAAIKSSSLEYLIKKHLKNIGEGNSHTEVIENINSISKCIILYNIVKSKITFQCKDITGFPWESSFERYLNTPPSGSDDNLMLGHMLHFLCLLAPHFKNSDVPFWICAIFKNENHYLSELLASDCLSDLSIKELVHSLFDLITECVLNEQHRKDFYSGGAQNSYDSWRSLTCVIIEHLQFNEAQHYYNLAYLDHLLSTLVHLTSAFGWSGSKPNEPPKPFLNQLTEELCELVSSFHCGKGISAADSLMGINITRNAILILNHVLAELQQFDVKNWETCFLEDNVNINAESCLINLCSLCLSRDVLLRAAVLHLLAGITVSTLASVQLVQVTKVNKMDIWELALSMLIDQEEANAVKENAAILLANLVSHVTVVNDKVCIIKSILPANSSWVTENNLNSVLNLLSNNNFYGELEIILKNLYREKFLYFQDLRFSNFGNTNDISGSKFGNIMVLYSKNMDSIHSVSSKDGSAKTLEMLISTPSVIKSISLFLYNLISIASEEIYPALQDYSIIKLLFRCLTVPCLEIETTKDISLYCDVLEMNAAICSLLTKLSVKNIGILTTICNTRDCLNVMLSLLDTNIYLISLPQLLYLRNKLWCSIFNLIEVILLNSHSEIGGLKSTEAFAVITSIIMSHGQESFLQSLCESINTKTSNDLQLSALSSLTSLLSIETEREDDDSTESQNSLQILLDQTKTPRTPRSETIKKINKEISKLDILQNVYFGGTKNRKTVQPMENNENDQMAGAELCSILLHLYELTNLKNSSNAAKKRILIVNALTSLLLVSREAKLFALHHGLLMKIMDQFKEIYIKLSLESVDCLRKVNDKKRVCPILKELESLVGLTTNFMYNDDKVKAEAASLGFADISHKLWIWFTVQLPLFTAALRMLCTFTTNCILACQTVVLTSSVAGSGPKKVPNNACLLQVVCAQIGKEMELISRTHNLTVLELCFNFLYNCMVVIECRVILLKINLLQNLSRLHPAITKNQKPWKNVELIWLEFLNELTIYPEGQSAVAKLPDVLDMIMAFTTSSKSENRNIALEVLRNLAFYTPNRARLLASGEFLNVISTKLITGNLNEKNIIVSIIWTIAANNQKAKIIFKCGHIDNKLVEAIKWTQLANVDIEKSDLDRMHMVLKLLRDGDRIK